MRMKQGCGGAIGHSCVAVGSAGDYALAETEQFRLAIQRCDEMHFRCSRIGEAYSHVIRQKHFSEDIRPVHANRLTICLHVRPPMASRS